VSHKRLARARWGEIPRISPHEKKKKISVVQKSGQRSKLSELLSYGIAFRQNGTKIDTAVQIRRQLSLFLSQCQFDRFLQRLQRNWFC
jgi:hypothetical protein